MEKEFLSKLLNLEGENEDYLSILEEGQCLVLSQHDFKISLGQKSHFWSSWF